MNKMQVKKNSSETASRPLRIGELAALSGKSVHTLRYYESAGLLPFVGRDSGGRRFYHVRHVQWLAFLERLQRTGMSISRMLDYATLVVKGRSTIPDRVELLVAHLTFLEQQLTDIEVSRRVLRAKIAFYQEWQASGQRPEEIWTRSLEEPLKALSKRPVRRGAGKSGKDKAATVELDAEE